MKIVIATGGTGGHILPAIKFARLLKMKYGNPDIMFFCEKNNRFRSMIEKEFNYMELPFMRFSAQSLFKKITAFFTTLRLYFYLKKYLLKVGADAVIGTGGFASFTTVLAAAAVKIPTLIHEQNILPGRANLFLSHYADVVGLSFAASKKYFRTTNLEVIGNPVYTPDNIERPELGNPKKILVFGGSLGARIINNTVIEIINSFDVSDFKFTIITGTKEYETVKEQLSGNKNVEVMSFSENMPKLYLSHDIVVARAGATTIAEICRFQIPAILIPFAKAYKLHQNYNAFFLKERAAVKVVLESELTAARLFSGLNDISRTGNYNKMLENIRNVFDFNPRERFLSAFDDLLKEKKDV